MIAQSFDQRANKCRRGGAHLYGSSRRDGMVDLDVDDDGIDLELWVELHLADVDHELLYDPALDGIETR